MLAGSGTSVAFTEYELNVVDTPVSGGGTVCWETMRFGGRKTRALLVNNSLGGCPVNRFKDNRHSVDPSRY